MAKTKPTNPDKADDSAKSSASMPDLTISEARKTVAKSLRCLYGLGVPDSEARTNLYDDDTIMTMATAELSNRRDKIPGILAQAKIKRES